MHPLEKSLLKSLRGQGLVSPGQRGLVCVSGGADSMALLHLLHALSGALDLRLEVVHFDHGLRPESAREAAWVAEHGAGLPFHLRSSTALRGRRGVQAAGRAWRREECARLIAEAGFDWVATGHQRDDQLETLLLKLLRGCSLDRLRGMAPRTGSAIRPLLDLTHAELRGYLQARGVAWLEDPSNDEATYKRNRVRNELLPLMDELAGGGIARRLLSLSEQAGQLGALLESFQEPGQNPARRPPHWISAPGLLALPLLAAQGALHRFIQQRLPGLVDGPTLASALRLLRAGKDGWGLDLSGGRRLRRRGGRLLLDGRPAGGEETRVVELEGLRVEAPAHLRVALHGALGGPLDGGRCSEHEGLVLHNLPAGACLRLRMRADGDRFHPPWRTRALKLKDFLRDQHVPRWERDALPCLVLEEPGREARVIAIYPKFVAKGYERPLPGGAGLCLTVAGGEAEPDAS